MTSEQPSISPGMSVTAVVRITVGVGIVAVLAYAYGLRTAAGDGNPFDYFGYFTNQTSLIAGAVLIATGAGALRAGRVPDWLALARGIATSFLIVVGVIYNVLVPGTGSAPQWVSVVLHVIFPSIAVADWLFIGDRRPLPWRLLWLLLPYPVLWLAVVLFRGVTDGWVPYGFLLPDRGPAPLVLHIAGILAVLLAAGTLVWAGSRIRVVGRTSLPTPR